MKLHGIYSNYLYCLKVFLKFHRVLFSHFVLWESIHPSTDIWAASTFWLLCIMLLWTARFKSAFNEEYIPRSGIAGAYGNLCKFLRNCHTIYHSSCTIWHSSQQCTSVQCLHILLTFSFNVLEKKKKNGLYHFPRAMGNPPVPWVNWDLNCASPLRRGFFFFFFFL